jgi:dTDP-4-amino-4,6-dideoxygalactose transaminase
MNIDLPYHQPCIDDDEINEVVATLKSGWLTTGSRTFQFENGVVTELIARFRR